jgi:CheY-like chemotaxis protein
MHLMTSCPADHFANAAPCRHFNNGPDSTPAEDEDLFSFAEEDPADTGNTPATALPPWVLLIVDDEPQVHEATTLTLRRGRVGGRPFRFLHAHSAAEARALILAEPQIDLILLDVMMETRDAGLRLVDELRGPMRRPDLRILIRSGQPGTENDHSVIEHYAVDGFMQKNQQTYQLMMEVIGDILLGTSKPDGASS